MLTTVPNVARGSLPSARNVMMDLCACHKEENASPLSQKHVKLPIVLCAAGKIQQNVKNVLMDLIEK